MTRIIQRHVAVLLLASVLAFDPARALAVRWNSDLAGGSWSTANGSTTSSAAPYTSVSNPLTRTLAPNIDSVGEGVLAVKRATVLQNPDDTLGSPPSTKGAPCVSITFPYTLVGADNAARVGNLRAAIECANLNATADSINLNGQTLILSNAFADYSGATGLPQITTGITLSNGTIQRDGTAPDFRFIAMTATADLQIINVVLDGGRLAGGQAGAIRNIGGALTLNQSTVRNATAAFTGAIHNDGGALRIIGSTIENNRTTNSSGNVSNTAGTLRVVNSVFLNNDCNCSNNVAGAIYNFAGAADIVGSTFTGNTGTLYGAVRNAGGGNSMMRIDNSTFAGNRSNANGGAISNGGAGITVSNSVITGNRAGSGGGIFNETGQSTIRNSTIAGNAGGGVARAGGILTVVNSVIWGNSGNTLTSSSVRYSVIEGGFAGTGNLSVDPLFAAPLPHANAPTTGGDYRLQDLSPATDAGSNALVPLDDLDANGNGNTSEEAPDRAGNLRRVDDLGVADTGAGTAPIVDMGAYEQLDSPTATLSVNPNSVLEDSGSSLEYRVQLSAPAPTPISINLSYGGIATRDVDYNGAVNSLSIAVGATSASVLLTPIADNVVESTESLQVDVVAGSGYIVGAPSSATAQINNDDTVGVLVTQTDGTTAVSESGATDTIAVVLTSEPTAPVQIALTGTQVTATPNLVFTSGNWDEPRIITVAGIDDALHEASPHAGSVAFALTSGDGNYNGFAVATLAVSVTDNDPAPTISISSPSQPEGNSGTSIMNFVVSLSAVSGLPVSFNRATVDGTATSGPDFVALAAAAATIPAGEITLTIPVTINGDTVVEGDQTFNLQLSAITNATPSPSIFGIGTIQEDDQQLTTSTINSDLPDPSVVGQPYPVMVMVAAVSSSPAGAVMISDGSASCGPVTLVPGTSPTSSATCELTSTSAGAKTLTASYIPASTAFAASSGTTSHHVNAAATTLSVTGPARTRVNTPTAFTAVLAVAAPGSGSPVGTISLSSGNSTCTITVPTATPNCSLSFGTLGPKTISGAFVPSNGNYVGSSSSGSGNAQTSVFVLSDLVVSKTDNIATYFPGDLLVYTVLLRNLGPDAAVNLRLRDPVPSGLNNVQWTCDGSGGAVCPANSGTGGIDQAISSFPVGALLNFTVTGTVQGNPALITNVATVELPNDATVEDINLGNNSASDTNTAQIIFRDGFEGTSTLLPPRDIANVSDATGSYRVPTEALRSLLDISAWPIYELRDAIGLAGVVYARVRGGRVELAVASRNGEGDWRLSSWQAQSGEPLLIWSAHLGSDGWVLLAVELGR